MADLNNCTLTGHLTKDAVSNTTPTGKQVVKFTIANNTGWGDNAKTLFVQVVVWGKIGQTLLPYLQKGKLVAVSGEVEMQEWVSQQDGSEQKRLALTANSVILLSSGGQQRKDVVDVEAEVVDDKDIQF